MEAEIEGAPCLLREEILSWQVLPGFTGHAVASFPGKGSVLHAA